MTLPVTKAVADASLDAANLLVIQRYPGSRRSDLEDNRAVKAILAHAPTASAARTWMIRSLERLNQSGAIERRKGRVGLFPVERAA